MIKRIYTVQMDDGSVWGIPAEAIADNRAKYYADIDPDTDYNEEYAAMLEWFDTNDFEFADWAKNNMDWDDVKDKAFLMPAAAKPEPDYQDGWVNGAYGYVTQREANE